MNKPIRIVEVGPRDGLQNEAIQISVEDKLNLVLALHEAGLQEIEVGSLVSPKWVPQMASSDELFQKVIEATSNTANNTADSQDFHMLVPNARGLERALELDVKTIAVFIAATDEFSQKNINCTIEESLERVRPVIEQAKAANMRVRGYVSCIFGCPYSGTVKPEQVVPIVNALYDMGCYEISLGDTIGVGTVQQLRTIIPLLKEHVPIDALALHLHDTYGQALVNVLTGVEEGITVFDSSVAGLGGCPYAEGATGNVATEDLLYLLSGLGCELAVEVDTDKLILAGEVMRKKVGGEGSKVARAALNSKLRFFAKTI